MKPKEDGIEVLREKLRGKQGRQYWRTLEEISGTPEFDKLLDDEFPHRSTLGQINRRDLLRFMGASLALAGLSGCRQVFLPVDKVVPYVKAPEELVPGVPLFYATALTLGGYATGVLVEQHEGRPVRVEGNPDHPASLGAADSFTQAEILNLYDPDRLQNVVDRGSISTWEIFTKEARRILREQRGARGAGVRILTGAVTSPTLASLLGQFRSAYPAARWHSYEPVGRGNLHAGARQAFGQVANTVYDFSQARVVVSLDGDFLNPAEFAGSLRYAYDFANGRRVLGTESRAMNRLYAFESGAGLVGAMADHRWPVRAADIAGIAGALATAVGVGGSAGVVRGKVTDAVIQAIARDLQANRGASIVVAGPHQSPEVHALCHQINQALGNVGTTVSYTASPEANAADGVGTIQELAADLDSGAVELLLIVGGNPAYDAPADLEFGQKIRRAGAQVHLTTHVNETSHLCDWVLPKTHELEEWGDARAFDGTATIMQPLVAPLYDGRSAIEVVSALLNKPVGGYDLVRNTWRAQLSAGGDFEKAWRRAVHNGVVPNSALPTVGLTAGGGGGSRTPAPSGGMEIVFRPDPSIYDGRYANNGWLQELPKPLTKLTWDNAVIMSPATAKALDLDLDTRDHIVDLKVGGRTVRGVTYVLPSHADETVTVYLGYGRTAGGTVAATAVDDEGRYDFDKTADNGGGFNAFLLRTSDSMNYTFGEVIPVGGLSGLASTQGHSPLDDSKIQDEPYERQVIRDYDVEAFFANVEEIQRRDREKTEEFNEANLYPESIFEWHGDQWGMTIDLNTCIGCNACVTACQSENNIPVVGKVQVQRHREMHWLRIDRYYSGDDPDNPDRINWQPMMCVHCEKAPCEPVCPVAATVHSHEGLNQMVYNRCVGTRYCSNNCPYRVRRFNFLNYSDNQPNFAVKEQPWSEKLVPGPIHGQKHNGRELLKMVNNPDVTVRGRGIMEKCTYCVQRINQARIEAKKAGRAILDGEIVTACQQACPTKTIVFGNIADQKSAVHRMRSDPRSYLVMEELLTRPRTSHLAKLRNPNPEIPA